MANLTCFTPEEVATRLGRTKATVYGYIRTGRLKAENYGYGREKGRYEISEEALKEFLSNR